MNSEIRGYQQREQEKEGNGRRNEKTPKGNDVSCKDGACGMHGACVVIGSRSSGLCIRSDAIALTVP